MFGFQKYLDQIYQIKWYFDAKDIEDIEHMLYVKFKSENDYYLLDTIHYTYIDILLGLEEMEFQFSKQTDDLKLKILKI